MKISLFGLSLELKALYFSMFIPAALALLATGQAMAQEGKTVRPEITAAPTSRGFVLRMQDGKRVCLEATPEEASRMRRMSREPEMRVIYAGRASQTAQAQIGLRIILRSTTQLDGFPVAKAAFIRAAQNWESQILSPITIVLDVDYGPTFFGEAYPNSNTIGQTQSQAIGSSNGYANIRSALIAGASTSAEAALYNTLPATQAPTDLGNVTAIFTDSAVFRALGLISQTANPVTEQASLGAPPRIGFNSAFPFDFDPTNGIASNQLDFDGTATHEIGHALGFGSATGVKELSPNATASLTLLDLFRFRPGTTNGTFATAQRILSSGGQQVFFAGGPELGLSTGRPDGTGGDRNQASHWKANDITGVYIGVMDPTQGDGERIQITQNDLIAFDTIGYRVRSAQQQLDVAPAVLDFGGVAVNGSGQQTLTVLNTGGQTLQVNGITINGARFSLVSPGTSFSIAPNGQQNVVLRFSPTASGSQIGSLSIASNDPNRPNLTLQLVGFGGTLPQVALTSGTGQSGTAPASTSANSCQLDTTQYAIQVPANSSQLSIALTGNQDIDLYVRFGQRVTGLSPNWAADFVSDSPNNTENVVITSNSTPGLQAGTYFIGVTNCAASPATYSLTATITTGNASLAAVSAASFRGTELSSESIASAFGVNLATATTVATTNPLPTSLSGTTVKVRDSLNTERLAPLFFVSPGQINFQVPPGTSAGTATITATNAGNAATSGTINIVSVAPGLFAANATGRDAAAAVVVRVRADGSQSFESATRLNTSTNTFVTVPIDLGATTDQVFVILFGSGFRNRSGLSNVTAQIGGTAAQVQFAGPQGTLVGLDQANVLLPRSLAGRGELDVVLTVDGKAANTVRVNIR